MKSKTLKGTILAATTALTLNALPIVAQAKKTSGASTIMGISDWLCGNNGCREYDELYIGVLTTNPTGWPSLTSWSVTRISADISKISTGSEKRTMKMAQVEAKEIILSASSGNTESLHTTETFQQAKSILTAKMNQLEDHYNGEASLESAEGERTLNDVQAALFLSKLSL